MNAEEARRKSIENAQKEIDKLLPLIEAAVNNGSVFIIVPYSEKDGDIYTLKEGTRKWLKDNGYYLYANSDNSLELVISWKNPQKKEV
ncbi:MAG TPA: hypothetical protein VGO58_04845 [Chitinophagaceae bacterium]|jgi:hypothetical protein|nr:hypothetical protein [Chitinophagaceae bacterium]